MKIQKTIRGIDSLKRAPELAEKLGMKHPMIVGGRTLTAKLLRRCPGLISCPVFTEYHPNPELVDAEKGAERFRRENCDSLISIGGGSAIDTAKAIKAILNVGSVGKLLQDSVREEEEAAVVHIAIPGTAGSGAEATQTAVVYVDGRKHSLSDITLLPEGVILDAGLLETLPVYHQKSCALDALAQGIESYWSRSATEESRVHAYLAILGVLDNLKAYLAGDPHAAEEMMDASWESGKAIQITRTTAAHAMSYQLTQTFGIAHGHACMLTLPILWEHMERSEEMRPVLKELSERMRLGNPGMAPRLLRGILYQLDMEIPETPDPAVLDRLTESVNTERLGNHPETLGREEIRSVYLAAFAKPDESFRKTCSDLWLYYGR